MISFRGVGKRYGKFWALQNLDLEVPQGEVLALLGPNGAGKSTALKALVGLLRPSQGTVRVAGIEVWQQPVKAKAQFGYVPDRPYLYGKLTGLELLRFAASVYRIPLSEAEQRIAYWLAEFRLERFAGSLIETYSHGMRQKLSVAMALLHRPRVLILDEPMVGLDPLAARQLRNLLQQLPSQGCTVLFATHQMALAQEVAHRVALIHQGQLVAQGSPAQLISAYHSPNLEEVFLRLTEDASQTQLVAEP
jgi:ABC-2 type transport system ATP-binding protein